MSRRLAEALETLRACEDAREWAESQRSYPEAWRRCKRGDWLLWLVARMAKSDPTARRDVVMAAAAIAELAIGAFVPTEYRRPFRAVHTAWTWASGGAVTRAKWLEATSMDLVTSGLAKPNQAAALEAATAAVWAAELARDLSEPHGSRWDGARVADKAAAVALAVADASEQGESPRGAAWFRSLSKSATIARRYLTRPELEGVS